MLQMSERWFIQHVVQCNKYWGPFNALTFCTIIIVKNKQNYLTELLNGFHLNGHTLGFHPNSKVKTTLYSIINSSTWTYCSIPFIWMVTHTRVSSTDSNVRNTIIDSRFDSGSERVKTNSPAKLNYSCSRLLARIWKVGVLEAYPPINLLRLWCIFHHFLPGLGIHRTPGRPSG